jgi:hypothetical protein
MTRLISCGRKWRQSGQPCRDQCYDFGNTSAEKFGKQLGDFDSYLEVGWARAEAWLFHLFSKAQAQEWHKPDLFSNVFKHAKTQAQNMKPEPQPKPAKIRTDPPLQLFIHKWDQKQLFSRKSPISFSAENWYIVSIRRILS